MIVAWSVVSASIGIFMGWQPLVRWADANPNMAGWTQAIGSVAAILATGAGVYWAQLLQERRHAEEEKSRKTAICNTALELVQGAADTLYQYSDAPTRPLVPIDLMTLQAQLEGLSHALQKIDLFVLGDFRLIEAVITSDAIIRKMALLVERALQDSTSLMLEWAGVQSEAFRGYVEVAARAELIADAISAGASPRRLPARSIAGLSRKASDSA
jgi:hypothetical protein